MGDLQQQAQAETYFEARLGELAARIEACLDRTLPPPDQPPVRLHEAIRYATLTGGKRVRPLLTYAAGECLGVDPSRLDVPATAIELIHAFSLVHDDLPAMDDDDLRRGQPTVHRRFDEATAILAADALQPLAFQVIADSQALSSDEKADLVSLVAAACGSLGMTGGQAIDLASQGQTLTEAELRNMHELKTGALIRASVMAAAILAKDLDADSRATIDRFASRIGLAFQIRDDLLDVEGVTEVIGKPVGSDEGLAKATWPGLFGIEESRRRCDELLAAALLELDAFGESAAPLRWLSRYIVERER